MILDLSVPQRPCSPPCGFKAATPILPFWAPVSLRVLWSIRIASRIRSGRMFAATDLGDHAVLDLPFTGASDEVAAHCERIVVNYLSKLDRADVQSRVTAILIQTCRAVRCRRNRLRQAA
jgi:hypothetical protein